MANNQLITSNTKSYAQDGESHDFGIQSCTADTSSIYRSDISSLYRSERTPSLTLAIGPSCFVRCTGCYNLFGSTAVRGGLVSVADLEPLLEFAQTLGIPQVTVSGGDPLSHPHILELLKSIHTMGFRTKLDTVGTPFLHEAQLGFFGNARIPYIDPMQIADIVDQVGLPLDGPTPEIEATWRKQLKNVEDAADVVHDTSVLTELLQTLGIAVCLNTVVHRYNVAYIDDLAVNLIASLQPALWQLFEFTPSGLMAQAHQDIYDPHQIDGYSFSQVVSSAQVSAPNVAVTGKSSNERDGIYFIVNDAGMAWIPRVNQVPVVIGHVVRDFVTVTTALKYFSGQIENWTENWTSGTEAPNGSTAAFTACHQ